MTPDPPRSPFWRSLRAAPPAIGVGVALAVVLGFLLSPCCLATGGSAGMVGFAAAGLIIAFWRPAAILAVIGSAFALFLILRLLEEGRLVLPEVTDAASNGIPRLLVWAALAVALEPVFRRLVAAPAPPLPAGAGGAGVRMPGAETGTPPAAPPLLVDTSALIDGRLSRLAETGLLNGRIVVPRAVLWELQRLRDSRDSNKRARGDRGLDQVARLRALEGVGLAIEDAGVEETAVQGGSGDGTPGAPTPVDRRLLALCRTRGARLLTTDAPLGQLAEIEGVLAINLHAVAEALALRAVPGARLNLALTRAGEQPGQAIGHLPDGTRVVVANARDRIGKTAQVRVTDLRKTRRGTLLFAELLPEGAADENAGDVETDA